MAKKEEKEKKDFTMNPFLTIWLIAMGITFVSACVRGMIKPTSSLGFLRCLALWFGIVSFIIGWIMGIVGLFFFTIIRAQKEGLDEI